MATLLDSGPKHLLRLIARDARADGWATVSKPVYPLLRDGMPRELIEVEAVGDAGRVRLTARGAAVVDAMDWL